MVMLVAIDGCVASLPGEPVYVEAAYVPVDLTFYPNTNYEGRNVYYIHDHWYYRDGTRWAYYPQEPRLLHEHRASITRTSPERRRSVAEPSVRRAPSATAPNSPQM